MKNNKIDKQTFISLLLKSIMYFFVLLTIGSINIDFLIRNIGFFIGLFSIIFIVDYKLSILHNSEMYKLDKLKKNN